MKKNTTRIKINSLTLMATGLALSLGLAGCQNSPRNDNLPELKELSAKLDALSRKIDAMAGQARAPAQQQPKRPTVGQLYKVPVGAKDSFRGGKDAKVTIVFASEFACPYCAQLASEGDKLLEKFADEDLRIVSKNFIVHPSIATKPAQAVCAASEQGKFAAYEGALWQAAWHASGTNQLNRDVLTPEGLDSIAKSVGLDLERFHSDMEGECQATVATQHRQMATLGVNGTPAIYINGAYYGGARSFEALQAAVSEEITRVDAELAKGASLTGYYDARIAKGKTSI